MSRGKNRHESKVLTPREEAFVKEFLANGRNKTRAFVATNTNPNCNKTPGHPGNMVQARQMIRRPRVAAAIEAADSALAERAKQHIAERYGATQEKVIEELAKLAFTDLADITTWDENGIKTKNSNELKENEKAAVTEVTQTKSGVRVKLADKQKALETLGRAMGIFAPEQHEHKHIGIAKLIIEKD